MDFSKTEVFLKEWGRMCKAVGCSMCEISKKGRGCKAFLMYDPAEAIKIVQEWSDVNPPKTRLSVLKKHFPNYRRVEGQGEEPEICAEDLFGINCPYPIPDDGVCMKCWNTPIEEE